MFGSGFWCVSELWSSQNPVGILRLDVGCDRQQGDHLSCRFTIGLSHRASLFTVRVGNKDLVATVWKVEWNVGVIIVPSDDWETGILITNPRNKVIVY